MIDVLKKQNYFQKEADKILEKLNLLKILSKFGKPRIIGSVALRLMTWRDIDIDLVVDELKDDDYFQVVKYLFEKKEVKRFILSDNRRLNDKLKAQGIPESIYLGIFVKDKNKNDEWKIDIRFVEEITVRSDKHTDEIKNKLNEENRKIILEIKNVVCKHAKYINKEIFGVDIYDAVLEKGVKDIEGFKKYLKRKGINL